MDNIPIIYKIIAERMLKDTYYINVIKFGKARMVLTQIFRMPHTRINAIIAEMENLGVLEIENCNNIRIKLCG